MAVSLIKRVENKDDLYCQTHCLNDLQNCAVAVHCDWTAPTTTAAPCIGNIFQCGGTFSINRGGSATNKGVCLFFETKTGSEDTDPGITSESNCKEVVYRKYYFSHFVNLLSRNFAEITETSRQEEK